MSHTIIFVLVLHLIADFILQPNWITTYKSRDNSILLFHVAVYLFVMTLVLLLIASWKAALLYSAVNAALHFCVDFITSRLITAQAHDIILDESPDNLQKPLFERVNLYRPTVLLGVDQLFHQACLVLTLPMLYWTL